MLGFTRPKAMPPRPQNAKPQRWHTAARKRTGGGWGEANHTRVQRHAAVAKPPAKKRWQSVKPQYNEPE